MYMDKKKGRLSVRDLVNANEAAYQLLKYPERWPDSLNGFDCIRTTFDVKSHHGGVAYYCEETGTLLLAHRGSVTARDWLITDVGIAFGVKETAADLAAVRFAQSVLDDLNRSGKPINDVIETGHSKGGRESQMVTAFLTNQRLIPCVSLTFNAARVIESVKQQGMYYNHINLRTVGGNLLAVDPVSSFGKQLGKNIDFHDTDAKMFLAHSLNSFHSGLDKFHEIGEMDVKEFVSQCMMGKSVSEIIDEERWRNISEKGKEEILLLNSNPKLIGNEMLETKGTIVAINNDEVIQHFSKSSQYFKMHNKSKFDIVPELGDELKIRYTKDYASAIISSTRKNIQRR